MLNTEIENTAELPVLPPGVTHLLHVLNDDQMSFEEVTNEIGKFPSISLKILAIANSAWAAPVCPIDNLLDACTRLGFQIVRSVAIALSVADVFDPTRCQAFDAKRFWLAALLDAEAAQLCARRRDDVNMDTARTAGLLKNIGLLWLAYNRPIETGDAFLRANNCDNVKLADALQTSLHTDHHNAGAILAEAMELPEALVVAIRGNTVAEGGKYASLIANTSYAHKLAEALLQAEQCEDAETELDICNDENYQRLATRIDDIKTMAEMMFRC